MSRDILVLQKIEINEPRIYAAINFGSFPEGELHLNNSIFQIKPRVIEAHPSSNGKFLPSNKSRIASAKVDFRGNVFDYDPSFLEAEDGVYSYEDMRIQGGRYSCNALTDQDGIMRPHPVLFKKNGHAKPVKVGDGRESLPNSKCVIFVDHSHFLNRPQRSLETTRPSVMLWRITRPDKDNLLEHVDLIRPFYEPDDGMALSGISAPSVCVRDGMLLFVHQVTSLDPSEKQYFHHVLLLDKDNPTEILAYTPDPILRRSDFPACKEPWIGGAIYIDNLYSDASGNWLVGFVSVDDRETYLAAISIRYILDKLVPWKNRAHHRSPHIRGETLAYKCLRFVIKQTFWLITIIYTRCLVMLHLCILPFLILSRLNILLLWSQKPSKKGAIGIFGECF